MFNQPVTPYERLLITRAIGNREDIAEAEANYFSTPDGKERLFKEGKFIELLFVNTDTQPVTAERADIPL